MMEQWADRELRELAAIIAHFRKNGLWNPTNNEPLPFAVGGGLAVKNTEASVIPAYGCMEVAGAVDEDGRNYIEVKKPTLTGKTFLFNSHIEIEANGYGQGLPGPLARAYKNSGTLTVGERWAHTSGQYYLTKSDGGQFVVIGADDIETDVFRVAFSTERSTTVTTVVTDIRVSGNNLQYKTRTITVLSAETESDWTTWHAGTECP